MLLCCRIGVVTQRLDEAIARTRALVSTRTTTGLTHQDADADIGTIKSDDAVNFDPRSLLAALQQSGVHVVVIGQVAGILHGSRELTGDLDLLWAGDPNDAEALVGVFSAAGADLADDQGRPLPFTREAFLIAEGFEGIA